MTAVCKQAECIRFD